MNFYFFHNRIEQGDKETFFRMPWLLIASADEKSSSNCLESKKYDWVPPGELLECLSRGTTADDDDWYWMFRTQKQALDAKRAIMKLNTRSCPKMKFTLRSVVKLPKGFS